MPMVFRADLSFIQEFSANIIDKKNTLQVRFDILNFTNLLSSDWGLSNVFTTTQPFTNPSVDGDGKSTYRLRNISGKLIDETYKPSATIFDVYRLQLGFRFNFN